MLCYCNFVHFRGHSSSLFFTGRQSRHTDQRSSGPTSRSKTPDRSDRPPAVRGSSVLPKPLPVFPLNPSSPPSSPSKDAAKREERERHEGEKKKSNQPNHQSSQGNPKAQGSKPGAPAGGGPRQKVQGRGSCGGKGLLSESQVRLLVGLYYLPHEHGPSAQRLLQDLTWLKTNCHLVSANGKKPPPQKVRVCVS